MIAAVRHHLLPSTRYMSTSKRPRVAPIVKAEMGGGGSKVWSEITELARLPSIVADLGQGYPDFNGDASARDRACEVLQHDARLNQYSLVNGLVPLRKSLSDFYSASHPQAPALNPDTQVLITSSGTEALFASISALVSPGDEVVTFDPQFPWYAPNVRISGGVLKSVPLSFPDFSIQESALRSAFSSRTKLVIVNSPHNPTGHVLKPDEGELIAKLCVEFDAFCISDEVYEHYIFDSSLSHIRMCDFPGMADRTLTVGSASKMFSLTGWRVGWLYGPEDLVAAARTMHSFASYCAATPLQEGVRAALEEATKGGGVPKGMEETNALFLRNAIRLGEALEKSFGLKYAVPEGGYFLVCDISGTGKTDVEFCSFLAKERGVVAVPMSVFFAGSSVNHLVRFAICKTEAVMDRAVKAILGN